MRLGFLEVILIVAVLLSVLVVWRWMREGGSDSPAEDGSPPSFLQRIGTIGILLVLVGLGLILVGYIVLIGLAKMFIWAVAILLLGVAFLVLSRR